MSSTDAQNLRRTQTGQQPVDQNRYGIVIRKLLLDRRLRSALSEVTAESLNPESAPP
jgi:hypothetical protein